MQGTLQIYVPTERKKINLRECKINQGLKFYLKSFTLWSKVEWNGRFQQTYHQAMKPYIAIAEKTKADAMKLFEQEMEK